MRVLVVEDDVKLARALQRGLNQEGYSVDVAEDGDRGLACAESGRYDAIVLDVMLPGRDGFSLCEELRRGGCWTPVLILSARGHVTDRVRGLDGGADDYLVKPFSFEELLARLRVLTRRGPQEAPAVLQIGNLHIDAATRRVTRSGRQIELTAREFDVLAVLARSPGQLVSRAELLRAVWRDDFEGSANVVDVYIGYLRRKLEAPGGRPLIRTVRGKGFVLDTS